MPSIEQFLKELKKYQHSDTVSNPYRNAALVKNLGAYLNAMVKVKGKRVLLVGEAPGYKGCKITGIPFTSGAVFERINHPLLNSIQNQLKFSKIEAENTATIVWEYLSTKKTVPLFWNSFPFHPHPSGNTKKNRAPTSDEIEIGIGYLQTLNKIFKAEIIAGIGGKGTSCAKRAFPSLDIACIRHPSFGGKAEFIKGMNSII